MTQNYRELIAQDIADVLENMDEPRLALVTRQPFNVEELAITQFPAVLVTTGTETRETVSMHTAGIRSGEILFNVRGFVRGTELDTLRNNLIERIEEALDSDRYRNLTGSRVRNSQVETIEIVERQPPLAEFNIVFRVDYWFTRGTA